MAMSETERLREERDAAIRERDELRRALNVENDHALRIKAERDAAIRERDTAKQHHARECAKCSALADKVISLKARVAELEAAPAAIAVSNPQPISGDGKSAVEETQAASGLTVEQRRALIRAFDLLCDDLVSTIDRPCSSVACGCGLLYTETIVWPVDENRERTQQDSLFRCEDCAGSLRAHCQTVVKIAAGELGFQVEAKEEGR